jgi:hypothetical protein
VAWAAVYVRIIPTRWNGDYQVFVSVAERLRAGDRLYADVWDNKDPLFFYTLALARSLNEFAAGYLDVAWILLAGLAVLTMSRWVGLGHPAQITLAFAATPVMLTGVAYAPGFSHLPGVAIVLCLLAAAVRDQWILVGALTAGLCFFKLVLLPVAACVVLVAIARRDGRAVAFASAAWATGCVALAGVLAVRGELRPWLDAQLLNVRYSQSTLLDPGANPVVAHVERVFTPALWFAMGVLVGLLVVTFSLARGQERVWTLWYLAASTLLASTLVTATTGLWSHHGLVFAVPAILGLVVLTRLVGSFGDETLPLGLVGLGLLSFALSGPVNATYYKELVTAADDAPGFFVGPSIEARSVADLGPTSFAAAGMAADDGMARGLGEWSLACPRLYQFAFDPTAALEDTADCLPSADVIFVGSSLDPDSPIARWAAFSQRVDETLERGYSCVPTTFGQTCTRTVAAREG